MGPIYYDIIHLREIIIQICRDHRALAASLINPLLNTFNLIVNYKTPYKPLKEKYLDDNKDDKLYLMDCQY